jgi:transposase
MNNDLTGSQRPRSSYIKVTLHYSIQVCSAEKYEYHAVRTLYYNFHINPLSPELNPICYLLALLAYDFLHVSRIRVKSLTLRLLMSYI